MWSVEFIYFSMPWSHPRAQFQDHQFATITVDEIKVRSSDFDPSPASLVDDVSTNAVNIATNTTNIATNTTNIATNTTNIASQIEQKGTLADHTLATTPLSTTTTRDVDLLLHGTVLFIRYEGLTGTADQAQTFSFVLTEAEIESAGLTRVVSGGTRILKVPVSGAVYGQTLVDNGATVAGTAEVLNVASTDFCSVTVGLGVGQAAFTGSGAFSIPTTMIAVPLVAV